MAELLAVLSVAGSVVNIAAEGIRLSNKLNNYVQNVKYAEKEICAIARDVKDTAIMLQQLGDNLEMEREAMICKPELYESAFSHVRECDTIFKEIDGALAQPSDRDEEDKISLQIPDLKRRERFKWPFKRSRISLLQSDLDRLKANLNLMISVMRHARDLYEKEVLDREKRICIQIDALKIKTLELETQAAAQKHESLKRQSDYMKGQPLSDRPSYSGKKQLRKPPFLSAKAGYGGQARSRVASPVREGDPQSNNRAFSLDSIKISREQVPGADSRRQSLYDDEEASLQRDNDRNHHTENDAEAISLSDSERRFQADMKNQRQESLGKTRNTADRVASKDKHHSDMVTESWNKDDFEHKGPLFGDIDEGTAEQLWQANDYTNRNNRAVRANDHDIKEAIGSVKIPGSGSASPSVAANDSRSDTSLHSDLGQEASESGLSNKKQVSDTEQRIRIPTPDSQRNFTLSHIHFATDECVKAENGKHQARNTLLSHTAAEQTSEVDTRAPPVSPKTSITSVSDPTSMPKLEQAKPNENEPLSASSILHSKLLNPGESGTSAHKSETQKEDKLSKLPFATKSVKFAKGLRSLLSSTPTQEDSKNDSSVHVAANTPRAGKVKSSESPSKEITPPQRADRSSLPNVEDRGIGNTTDHHMGAMAESDLRMFLSPPPPQNLTNATLEEWAPVLESWVLRRADMISEAKSWMRVTMKNMHLDSSELEGIVAKQEKGKSPIWAQFAKLSSYQQQQIDRLIASRATEDIVGRHYAWSLKALQIDPKKAKGVRIKSIQLVLQRRLIGHAVKPPSHGPTTSRSPIARQKGSQRSHASKSNSDWWARRRSENDTGSSDSSADSISVVEASFGDRDAAFTQRRKPLVRGVSKTTFERRRPGPASGSTGQHLSNGSLEDRIDDMSLNMGKLQRQVSRSQDRSGRRQGPKITDTRPSEISSVSGPYYNIGSPATLKSLQPETTVANLLSKWTIIDSGQDTIDGHAQAKQNEKPRENNDPVFALPYGPDGKGQHTEPEIDDMD